MEAKELRIGNWIEVVYNEVFVEDSFEQCNRHHLKDMIEGSDYFSYNPIPLTEEWLLKFGFEKGDDILGVCFSVERQYLDDFVIHHYKDTSFEFFPYDVTVTHVHQLQNLFYALTGEELTFND